VVDKRNSKWHKEKHLPDIHRIEKREKEVNKKGADQKTDLRRMCS
jgi:hypothetical protein